jgi:hypothetical protein
MNETALNYHAAMFVNFFFIFFYLFKLLAAILRPCLKGSQFKMMSFHLVTFDLYFGEKNLDYEYNESEKVSST